MEPGNWEYWALNAVHAEFNAKCANKPGQAASRGENAVASAVQSPAKVLHLNRIHPHRLGAHPDDALRA
jgi:hypothetical protein